MIRRLPRSAVLTATAAVLVLAACSGDGSSDAAPSATTVDASGATTAVEGTAATDAVPTVVVTYSVLGAVVAELVRDAATVQVLVPNGQDPHEFAPSAKDVEAIGNADLVVANGLDMEEQLADAIEQAEADGVPVFHATDHITLRELGADDDDHAAGDGDHQGADPHFWTDPLAMRELSGPLAAALEEALGVDLSENLAKVQTSLDMVDAGVRSIIGRLPAGSCKLVTGHDSLGYFADRYGCVVVGAVIPSLSSSAEASAKELAVLRRAVEAEDVPVVFTEVGTPPQVAQQVAEEAGVPVVELPSHAVPDAGGYAAFVTDLARRIEAGLRTR